MSSWALTVFIKEYIRETSPSSGIRPILYDNVPIVALVLIDLIAICLVHAVCGIHDQIIMVYYFGLFSKAAILFSCVSLIPHVLKKSYHRYISLRYIIGFLTVLLLAPIFDSAFASYKQTIRQIYDFRYDALLMRIDCILHFGRYPWELFAPVLRYSWIVRAVDILYMLWFVILMLFCLWMAWSRHRRLRLCFFISMLLVWILVGQVLATALSSAGPCYFSKVAVGNDPYTPLMSRLAEIHRHSFLWAIENQEGLWYSLCHRIWQPFGGISAMPSMHVAIATIFVLLSFEIRKWLGFIFIGYLGVIQIGSVILGWHYAVDGYFGILLACLIWYVTRKITCRWLPVSEG